jgi:MoaA/NifB/PqqE/SkfB family radical SAM enzyme
MNLIEDIRIGKKIAIAKILKRKCLLSVEFGITYQCNLTCKYCFKGDFEDYFNPGKCPGNKDMSLEQIKNVFVILKRLGAERINLSGGEPLLRKDIDKILESAFLLGSKISLTTNGVLVPKYIDLLTGLGFLCVSINGDRETHNYLAGADTHEAVMKAIDLSITRKIRVLLSAVITSKTTEKDLQFLLRLADYYRTFCILQPVFEGGFLEREYVKFNGLNGIIPALRQIERLFEYLSNSPYRKLIVGGKSFLEFTLKFSSAKEKGSYVLKKCAAGNSFFYISPEGYLFPCSLRFQKLFNGKIYEHTFEEIEENKINQIWCRGCCCYSNNILDRITGLDWKAIASVLLKQYV